MKDTKLQFLDEFGDENMKKDETLKNLIFTCEEGVDYSFLETATLSVTFEE
jgi:hypothetical protein